MYKYTRQEVADKLNISTRSVDRYIKAWKFRSKKMWKIVYINSDDIDWIISDWENKHEIIYNKEIEKNNINESSSSLKKEKQVSWTLSEIYKDLKNEIEKKDELIKTLAIRVWKAEEMAKNTVSLLDFKKSQYLLEESKQNLNNELSKLEKEKLKLLNDLKIEKKSNIVLILFVLLLLTVSSILWIMQI